jgi:hypothetical protein
MAELTWMFEQIGAWGGSTGQAWKNILVSTEDLTEEGRLVREASQNANDAHDKKCGDPAVRIKITRKVLSAKEIAKLTKFLGLESELEKRLPSLGLSADNAFSKMLKGKGEVEITIIGDFNTVGLGGALAGTHGETLEGDHFQKLLFLLGGSDKITSGETTGGSYGFGKSVYSALSDCQTVIYYSRFKPD